MHPNPLEQSVVAIYDSHTDAEAAIRALHAACLDMKRLSVVGSDLEAAPLGFTTADEQIVVWGRGGALWGSLCRVLVGSAFFFIPAVGPLVVMGPLVGLVVSAIEGAATGGGAGVLVAALMGLGISREGAMQCDDAVKTRKFLVLACGDDRLVDCARAALDATRVASLTATAAA